MNFRMIQSGLAVAALTLMSVAAQAADLPRGPYKAPAYVAPAYANWSGFYAGFNLGYGFGKSSWESPAAVDTKPKGGVYGLTFGYNYQTGIWVWGAEGDIGFSSVKGDVACAGDTCTTKNSWLSTVRGRLGYAGWNNWLPYLTAGGAAGNIKATETTVGSASKTRIGWTAGAGVEYAIYTNWSVKLEYLYVDLGKFDCGAACSGPPANVDFKENLVRAGLNYRF